MNELAERSGRDGTGRRGTEPRAVVHKNILDRAAAEPDAPMSDIATDVPGANVDIVERVLEEYGDPGAEDDGQAPEQSDDDQTSEQSDEMPDVDHDDTTDSEPMGEQTWDTRQIDVPDVGSLTEKQRSTLRTIREHPDATQAKLAELMGVSSATINTRVNAIDGFEWDRRHEFVDRLFGTDTEERYAAEESDDTDWSDETDDRDQREQPTTFSMGGNGGEPSNDDTPPTDELAERIDELAARIESFGDCIDDDERQPAGPFEDPELVHKILRACLADDEISADEELRIVKGVFG